MIKKYYKVNPEKKTVTAYTYNYTDFSDEIAPYGRVFNYIFHAIMGGCNRVFSATATCDERDNFDTRTGTELAGIKTDLKYHKYMAKKYQRVINILRKALVVYEELEQKHWVKCNRIEKDIEEHFK